MSDFQEFRRNFETHYKRQLGFIFSDQTSLGHTLDISNHTIPDQDILSPFLGLFDLFFEQKYQKVGGFDLRTHIP